MTTTILLVGHGSRNHAGNDEIQDLPTAMAGRHPDWRIEVCFIEHAEVLLDDGLDRAARGAGKVLVVPLILNAAGHVKMELPAHIAEARERHPEVEFVYAPHLGGNEDILGVLEKQLEALMQPGDARSRNHRRHPARSRLVGSGANGELAKMARWVFEDQRHELVDLAFTGVTWPRLETSCSAR